VIISVTEFELGQANPPAKGKIQFMLEHFM
jgi:hypothetical protein